MIRFMNIKRSNLLRLPLVKEIVCLLICSWLAFMQPGMSYYWLMDPHLHAEIDAEEYGQLPNGQTLPGQPWHPPHEHPTSFGASVEGLTLRNPFDEVFYNTVFSAAQRPALRGLRVDSSALGQSITVEPPDQPPRVAA